MVGIRSFKLGSGVDVKYNFRMYLISESNYDCINSHIPAITPYWRKKIDIQLVIDIGNLLDYMFKYVTK